MTARRIKGAWWVDFRLNHERIRKKSPLNTKRGAEVFEKQLREELILGIDEPKRELPTYKEHAQDWMDTYVLVNNKPSEVAAKRKILKHHLLPFFGKMRLDEISKKSIDRFKGAQIKAGLQAKTINNHLTVLRRSLTSAVEWELLPVVPTVQWLKARRPDFDFFTHEESEQLLAVAPPGFHAMLTTALKTGLRRGELLVLRWQDVDFRAGAITVRQALSLNVVSTPKSGRSRTVPMSAKLKEILLAHRHDLGPYVFCKDDGLRFTSNEIKRVVPQTCEAAGLRELNWHGLRHSFASQLAIAGVPLKVIQELLGHASIEMTMRYAHLAESALQGAVAVLDRAPVGHHLGTNDRGVV